ncbi:MAG: PAS domain-containing protein [Alphaproteobacteria bacterium]|nr:PAS domain-containing protein [Alphaproteobacteria bacterium]
MAESICNLGFAYWERLRSGREIPLKTDFDPLDIPRLLPNVVLMEVVDGGADFRHRVIGTAVRFHFLADHTGRLLSTLDHIEPDGELMAALRRVVRTRRPLRDPVTYVGPQKDFKKNDEIILPLGDGEGAVSHLLILIEFVSR